MRVANPCQTVVGISTIFSRFIHITSRRAEYHAVLTAVDTDGSASDGNIGRTRVGATIGRFAIGKCEPTHRAIRTATIYIMVDLRSVTDGHCGCAPDETGIDSILAATTTTVDIAHSGSTEQHTATVFDFIHTNYAAFYLDGSAAANAGHLAAAEDTAQHRAFGHLHLSIAEDNGSKFLHILGIRYRLVGLSSRIINDVFFRSIATAIDTAKSITSCARGRASIFSTANSNAWSNHRTDGAAIDIDLGSAALYVCGFTEGTFVI